MEMEIVVSENEFNTYVIILNKNYATKELCAKKKFQKK